MPPRFEFSEREDVSYFQLKASVSQSKEQSINIKIRTGTNLATSAQKINFDLSYLIVVAILNFPSFLLHMYGLENLLLAINFNFPCG